MKASTIFTVAAAAYTVSAQLDSLPTCALNCAVKSLGSSGCPTTDIACICKATAFVTSLVPCVQGACSAAEFEATVQAAQGLCQQAGVSLDIPTGGATTSAASTSTDTATATETLVVVPTTTTASETVVVPVNTTMTSEMSMPTNGTTSVSPPTPSGTDGSSASRNAVTLGGLGALVAFVAALL